jgi:tight adherence protein C
MIAVEAGLGFEAALGYVSDNLDSAIGEEFAHALQDIKVGLTRSQAFDALTRRTDVPELRQFVVALQQAEKLGVPIAKVLRVQSSELRVVRRQNAEENAQKLPVKMILPLILCILPALVVVILAPAAFDAMDTFS